MAALEAILLSIVPSDERTLRLLLTSFCLVAALLVAALVVALVNRWRRRRDAQEDVSPNAQLAHFRSLFEAGTISKEEFERLRAVLGAQLRQSMGAKPAPSQTDETPIPPENKAGETAIQPAQPPPPPPEIGIQRPDGPDTGIRPA